MGAPSSPSSPLAPTPAPLASAPGSDSQIPVGRDWLVAVAAALVVRPHLWATAVRQVFVLATPGWWLRAPRLPVPDVAYLRFRIQTAYGDQQEVPTVSDVVTYLHWCRAWPRVAR